MYEIAVDTEFCAAHAIVIRGEREPVHGHNWKVRVVVRAEALDEDGLVCDFHALDATLNEIIAPFRDADLNTAPPFNRQNPTAEHVARHIGESVGAWLFSLGENRGLRLSSVRVTEAPRCAAVYRPDAPHVAGNAEGAGA
ncbi:MAG: 6-carboxytetrahydropterin synthase [Phycisphaerales bacterium]|nr:MAG: 6-carboxytetrahydropterin synthase [Phycisphaerales bacterium]